MAGTLGTPAVTAGVLLFGVPLALIIAALAALIAIWAVITQRIIARRRATLNHIIRQESDSELIKSRQLFITTAKSNGGLVPWSEEDKEKSNQAQAIRLFLNEFELISISIQKGIIDYEMYKRWNKSGTLGVWASAAPFIYRLRERLDNDAIFHEFEQLANWLKDDRMPKRYRWMGYWF